MAKFEFCFFFLLLLLPSSWAATVTASYAGAPGSFAPVPITCYGVTNYLFSIPAPATDAASSATVSFRIFGDLSFFTEFVTISCEGFSTGPVCNENAGDDIFGGLAAGDDCVSDCATYPSGGVATASIPQAQWNTIVSDGIIDCNFIEGPDAEINCFCGGPTGFTMLLDFTWEGTNSFPGGSIGGDPHIVGFNQRLYNLQVPLHSVVNIFSTPLMQFNAILESPPLRSHVSYIQQLGVQVHQSNWVLYVDSNTRERAIEAAAVQVELRNTVTGEKLDLEQLRHESIASGYLGYDLIGSENEQEQAQQECRLVVLSNEDAQEKLDEIAALRGESRWSQAPVVMMRLRCFGEESIIEVHELHFEVVADKREKNVAWVQIGREVHSVINTGENRDYVERRIDVHFTAVNDELLPEGVVGRTHSSTIEHKRRAMNLGRETERETEMEGDESEKIRDAFLDTFSSDEEYVLKSGELFGRDFDLNRFQG